MNSKKSDRPDAGGGVRLPHGYALVPTKPTPAMIEAGCEQNPTQWNEGTDLGFAADVANDVYVAMVSAAALSTPPAAVESNASVEARLREAILASIDMIENCAGVPTNPDSLPQMVKVYLQQALSAVGDEAKVSIRAPAREPGMGWELSDETKARLAEIDDNLRNAAINASNIVAGSPPSPTAERREIVALDRQFIIDLIREKYDPVPSDWLATDAIRWDDGTGEIADAILAALDGGAGE